MHRAFSSKGRISVCLGPRTCLKTWDMRYFFLPLQGVRPRFIDSPARSLICSDWATLRLKYLETHTRERERETERERGGRERERETKRPTLGQWKTSLCVLQVWLTAGAPNSVTSAPSTRVIGPSTSSIFNEKGIFFSCLTDEPLPNGLPDALLSLRRAPRVG